MTKKDFLNFIEQNQIDSIQMQFINIEGYLQSIEVSTSQSSNIYENLIMIDGSSIKGYSSINASDLFLKPDWTTLLKIDFITSKYNVARVLCFIVDPQGKSFPGDPRSILAKKEKEFRKLNYELYAAFEPEFFLVKKENDKIFPADNTGYFGVFPLDTGDEVKREIIATLKNHGFEVEAFHKEVAFGQHEINFKYDTALKTADRLITFKWIVRSIAFKHDYIATFMPKPFKNVNGSGLHTNLSIFKDGQNIFARKKGEKINKIHSQFISGILNRAKEMCAITNPTVNSYKRLIPGFEAPNCISWSDSNRSTMIRVPASFGSSTRVEQRNVDASSNPYFALTLIFTGGIEGIETKIKTIEPSYENLFKKTRAQLKELQIELLPDSLGSALYITSQSAFVKKVLGEHSFKEFIKCKYHEWDEYRQIVHSWEIEKYLDY